MFLRILTLASCAALGALVPLLLPPPSAVPGMPRVLRLRTESQNGWSACMDAHVDGRPVVLGLDTGGETSSLPPEFKGWLPILSAGEAQDSNGLHKVFMTQPASLIIQGHDLGPCSFRLNGEYLKLTHGRILWSTDKPVLGLDVLTRYRFQIDGPAGTLTLSDDAAPLEGDGWISYRGMFGSPHIVVDATAPDGRTLLVFLDTGYARSRLCKTFASPGETPLVLKIGPTVVRASGIEILERNQDLVLTHGSTGETIVIQATLGWDVMHRYIQEVSPRNQKLRLRPPGIGN